MATRIVERTARNDGRVPGEVGRRYDPTGEVGVSMYPTVDDRDRDAAPANVEVRPRVVRIGEGHGRIDGLYGVGHRIERCGDRRVAEDVVDLVVASERQGRASRHARRLAADD